MSKKIVKLRLELRVRYKEYTYNGKEIHKDGNLNWQNYRFRFYDPSIARFTGVDPIAYKMPNWSPYAYAYNSPISFIDPDGREPKSIGDPPKRGVGVNAPYYYNLFATSFSGHLGKQDYASGDNMYHYNAIAFTGSVIPNRFISHYKWGGGSTYHLNQHEFDELNISRPSLTRSKEFKNAPIGKSKGVFTVPKMTTTVDGTVGEYSMEYNGVLIKSRTGSYQFNGTMQLTDTYDFNLHSERSVGNWLLTFWGKITMVGAEFDVKGPKVLIQETERYNTYYDRSSQQFSNRNAGAKSDVHPNGNHVIPRVTVKSSKPKT